MSLAILLTIVFVVVIIMVTFMGKKVFIKNKNVILVLVFISAFLLAFNSGYRITSISAAKANKSIDTDSVLIRETHRDWVDIYYYFNKNKDTYYSVIVEHKGLLYHSSSSVYLYNYDEDDLKTIGQVSYMNSKGKNIMTLLVASNTNEVSYIEAGPKNNRVRIDINKGGQALFEFDNVNESNNLDPIAYNDMGEEIYYYGYIRGSSYLKFEDYKWHKINAE